MLFDVNVEAEEMTKKLLETDKGDAEELIDKKDLVALAVEMKKKESKKIALDLLLETYDKKEAELKKVAEEAAKKLIEKKKVEAKRVKEQEKQ